MGFHRTGQPRALTRVEATTVLRRFVGEREIAEIIGYQDPFCIAEECAGNPAGHYPIRSAGDIVCAHAGCGKVLLR